jgi:hypothetical protein
MPDRAPLPPELRHMPVDPHWGLPIPFINERDGEDGHFAVLDPRRAIFCYERRLCAMCGLRMDGEVALYGDEVSLAPPPDGFFIEAPTHERCMELALGGICPFISAENYRRRRVDDPTIIVIGGRDHLPQIGREIAKRPAIVAIASGYQMATAVTDDGTMPIYMTSDILRVRRFGWVDGKAAEVGHGRVVMHAEGEAHAELTEAELAEPERRVTVVRSQRRRLPRSKRGPR